jgi:hypothetical protein
LGVAAQTTAAATCDTDDDTVSAEDIPAIVTRDGERVVTAYSAALTSLGWEKRYSNPIGQPSVGPGQLDLGISQLCYVRADTELLLYGQLFIESTGAAGLGYTFRVTAARSNKWDLCGS